MMMMIQLWLEAFQLDCYGWAKFWYTGTVLGSQWLMRWWRRTKMNHCESLVWV